jgi:hypothetical protein
MKKLFVSACLFLACVCAMAQSLKPTAIGLHLGTWHSQPGFNNTNPGAFAQWGGWTVGGYYNSERATSLYAGYTWETQGITSLDLRLAATAGVISGYRRASLLPLLVPTASMRLWSDQAGGQTRLQFTYVPPVDKRVHALHLSIKREF